MCRIAAVLVAIAFALPAAAEIFPDENLEAAVRHYVFEKRHNDEPITAEDVANISTITARDKGIRDLTGLEHCKRLMLLELPGNEVSDLSPIAGLNLLQSLTLTGNQVEDISRAGRSQAAAVHRAVGQHGGGHLTTGRPRSDEFSLSGRQ